MSGSRLFDVCVVGAGPAGSSFAARMAQLGHSVCLIEKERFPRRHLGESLTPGVLPLLAVTGAHAAVEAAGFPRVHAVDVCWEAGPRQRHDPRAEGLLVERGAFDQVLLAQARASGVHVIQPARMTGSQHDGALWRIGVSAEAGVRDSGASEIRARFLADARGRGAPAAGRRRTGCPTLALHAYWRGPRLPPRPRIEAGREAWFWGVPLPDGSYNTLAFVDPRRFRRVSGGSLEARFAEVLNGSGLMAGCLGAEPIGPILATDATAYLDVESATATQIRLGDAALALDPLSSSGVQKAIQTALAAAVVVNTILRRPSDCDAALEYYRGHLATASDRHRHWAAGHYDLVAAVGGSEFWRDRAGPATGTRVETEPEQAGPGHAGAIARTDPVDLMTRPVALSALAEFVSQPCLEGDFVATRSALRHPRLDGPVAYLGGRELVPLLRRVVPGLTPRQIARSWSATATSGNLAVGSGLAILAWLLDRGVLETGPAKGATGAQ
jgi:flavin-dependent dehydrogenase